MSAVKWGVISTANIGVAKVIPGMQKSDSIEIAAISSRKQANADDWAQRLRIPKAYGSYEELLADPEIEAIYNPLPNHLHVPWSIKAMEAGKHVLCEKPLGVDRADAERLMAVRDATGMLIQEAFMVRTYHQWLKVKEIADSGRIGDVRFVEARFSYFNDDPNNVRNMPDIGGGGILDIGCYPIVLSRFIYGEEPQRVVSLIDRDQRFGTDRTASALMEFSGGRQAMWMSSTQLSLSQTFIVMGTRGRIEVDIPYNPPPDASTTITIDDGRDLTGGGAEKITLPILDQYMVQGEEFGKAIRGQRSQAIPLESSLANMRVIDACFESEKNGGWVDI